jgi:hypothetical protein
LSAIAQAYRIEVEALGASMSVSQLADTPREAAATPLAAPATDEPAAQHMILVTQVPSNTVRETAKVQMILLPLAAELSNPLQPQELISTADAAAVAPIQQGAALPIDGLPETFAACS